MTISQFELGQHSIDHYALSHRAPVFSHAELLCRMAASTEPLDVDFLFVVSKQLESLLTTERSLRRHLARLGVRRAERMVFEETEDEKRECDLCRTTLYLSALTCRCKSSTFRISLDDFVPFIKSVLLVSLLSPPGNKFRDSNISLYLLSVRTERQRRKEGAGV